MSVNDKSEVNVVNENINEFSESDSALKISEWLSLLKDYEHNLNKLTSSTEKDFLAVGSKVQEFFFKAQDISGKASTVADNIAGQQISGAIQQLNEILVRINDYIGHSEGEVKETLDLLKNIMTRLNNIFTILDNFGKSVRMLRMLGISTKIESARLNNDDSSFDTLATDVQKLAGFIESKIEIIFSESDNLGKIISQTLSKIASLQERHYQIVKSTLINITTSIQSLSDRHNLSSTTIGNISNQTKAITENTGNVVASMQFHDITRQQIEHVEEALTSLRGNLGDTTVTNSETPKIKLTNIEKVGLTGNVVEIQIAQLANSLDELMLAVHDIMNSMDDIADRINAMGKNMQSLVRSTDDNDASFLSEIENGINLITSSLNESTDVTNKVTEMLAPMTSTVTSMASFVKDIRQVGIKIGLISLNAIVKAAHTGQEGVALAVLAESIQRLSVEAREQTFLFSETLNKIVNSVDSLKIENKSDTEKINCESCKIVEDLRVVLENLKNLNEKIVKELTEMDSMGETLASEIQKTVQEIDVHKLFDQIIRDTNRGLESILKDSRSLVSKELAIETMKNLGDLGQNYTMQKERRIHDSINFQKNETTEDDDLADIELFDDFEDNQNEDENFGDNIELF